MRCMWLEVTWWRRAGILGGGELTREGGAMSSPFPGMDPYIESCGLWGDFHQRLITGIADQLAEATPERYLVRTQERSYLVLVESEGRAFIEEEHREAF